jgi:hypothetical protein
MRLLLVVGLAGLTSFACSSRVVPTCDAGASNVPGFPDMTYDFSQCQGAWSPRDIGLGTYVFLSEWEASFGVDDRVTALVTSLNLECRDEDWVNEYWGMYVSGLTGEFKTSIALKSAEYGHCRSLPTSAFIHELVHTALIAMYGNGDADHDQGTQYGDVWHTEHTLWVEQTRDYLAYLLRIEDVDRNVDPVNGRCFDTCSLE